MDINDHKSIKSQNKEEQAEAADCKTLNKEFASAKVMNHLTPEGSVLMTLPEMFPITYQMEFTQSDYEKLRTNRHVKCIEMVD